MNSTFLSKIGKPASQIFSLLTDLAVPPTCIACDCIIATPGGCCAQCWRELRFVSNPHCPVMGTPFSHEMGDDFLCAEAIADPPPFDRLRMVMLYDEIARRLISSIKYSDRLDLVPTLAKWMAVSGRKLLDDCDVIVPIPLHTSRLRQRRFNQSAELARQISRSRNCRYEPHALVRRKATRQQVGLSEADRARNVAGAFTVSPQHMPLLQGRRVLLIDDVYTTGATARAATRALQRGGAKAVDVLVFAKVETFEL